MVIEGDSRPDRVIEKLELPLTSGQTKSLPGRGGGEIALGFAMLERAKRASHIEFHQRHPIHHAEGMFPTAERTLDLARMFEESLPPRPELENGAGSRTEVGGSTPLPRLRSSPATVSTTLRVRAW